MPDRKIQIYRVHLIGAGKEMRGTEDYTIERSFQIIN